MNEPYVAKADSTKTVNDHKTPKAPEVAFTNTTSAWLRMRWIYTPTLRLMQVLQSGEDQPDKVRDLLAQGAYVDVQDVHGVTPLALAVQRGHTESVKLLLQKKEIGLTFRIRDENGRTPLLCAIANGYDEIAQQLIQHKDIKLSLEVEDSEGRKPLVQAIFMEKAEIVKALLDKGCDFLTKTSSQLGALEMSVIRGNKNIFDHLYEKMPVYSVYLPHGEERCLNAAIRIAILCKRVEMFEALIKKYVPSDRHFPDDTRRSHLEMLIQNLVEKGHLDMLKLLVCNMSPEQLDHFQGYRYDNSDAPLVIAARYGQTAMVAYLLEKGFTRGLEKIRSRQKTALTEAAREGHMAVLSLLMGTKESKSLTRLTYKPSLKGVYLPAASHVLSSKDEQTIYNEA